ncbi:MAG: phenylalanine--tRNA ligase subunit beta [Buchnera aphidicola (Eriosoma harunire)]
MKFTEKWLREWVNPAIKVVDLCDQLSQSGLEVEYIQKISGDFSGVVVGEIVAHSMHPNIQNFYILEVNIGLCNNINIIHQSVFFVVIGMKVAVALIGSMLSDKRRITAMFIKGVLSEGYLCSFKDFEITYMENNIVELPINAEIGVSVNRYLSDNDNIITVSVNSNRSDVLYLIGIAREVAVLNTLPLPKLEVNPAVITNNDVINISIKHDIKCKRYFGRLIKDVNLQVESPFWLKEKLRRINYPVINIVIDLINYCMLTFGQIFHVFDADNIYGSITIRHSFPSEEYLSLEKTIIKCHDELIVISNSYNDILSIYGIINTDLSNFDKYTKNIFLGCIYLPTKSINVNCSLYELDVDLVDRFNKGIDYNVQFDVMEFFTNTILEYCGGNVGPVNRELVYDSEVCHQFCIRLYYQTVYKILGCMISVHICNNILIKLGYNIIKFDSVYCHVNPPSWRFDIKIEEDIISDIMRIYGLNNIPKIPIKVTGSTGVLDDNLYSYLDKVKIMLVNRGYYEVITYGFVNPSIQKVLMPNQEYLLVNNPISQEMSSMRLSLWPGLLNTIIYNQNRQQQSIRLFEVGLCFIPNASHSLHVQQEYHISGIVYGYLNDKHWGMEYRICDFYDIKGDLESILDINQCLDNISFKKEQINGFDKIQSAAIYCFNKKIGSIGMLDTRIQEILNLKHPVFIFNIFCDELNLTVNSVIKDISNYPCSQRDISIILDDNVDVFDVINVGKVCLLNKIIDIYVCDIYRSNRIGYNKKSVSLRLIFNNQFHTLKDSDIISNINEYILRLNKCFKATLRHIGCTLNEN